MKIVGLDFSAAKKAKTSFVVSGAFEGDRLYLDTIAPHRCGALETVLAAPGDWVLGLDVPFSQPAVFVEAQGWPPEWEDYCLRVLNLESQEWRALIDAYRSAQPAGKKEPKRCTDDSRRGRW